MNGKGEKRLTGWRLSVIRLVVGLGCLALSAPWPGGICVAAETSSPALRLVPHPKKIMQRKGTLRLDPESVLTLGNPESENDRFAAELLAEEWESLTGRRLRIVDGAGKTGNLVLGPASHPVVAKAAAKQGIEPGQVLIPEGYVLGIGGNGAVLAGADDAGTFYAVQTFRQALRGAARDEKGGLLLPKARIDDWPSFPFRGITDDISRGPIPTMKTIKENLDRLAGLKINKFNFYIEHVFCYEKHPDIGPDGGCLTAADLREIDAYARRRHIELIGGLQSFGHQKHMLSLRAYNHLAENIVMPWTITPSKKESYELLDDLYSEIAPPVSSNLFNVSCDETWDLGGGQSKKMVEEKGIAWVYARHIQRIHGLLEKRGKRILMWADIALNHPDILEMVPKNVVFLPWNYSPRENFNDMLEPIRATGHDFIVSPGVNCWNRMFPSMANARDNIGRFARDGARFGAWGVLNTTWDDDGENLFGYNWLPLAWGAEASWNPWEADYKRFENNFSGAFFGLSDDRAVEGLNRFEEAGRLPSFWDLGDPLFWEWPVHGRGGGAKLEELDAKKLLKLAREAESRLSEAKDKASTHAELLEYPLLAARRLESLAKRRLAWWKCLEEYERALKLQKDDPAATGKILNGLDRLLEAAEADAGAAWNDYRKVWLMENRPYWLDRNQKKYEELAGKISSTRKKLAEAKKTWAEGNSLPAAGSADHPFSP